MFPLISRLSASFWSYLGYVLQIKCFDGSWSNCICIPFIFANLISESRRCDCNFSCGENGFKQGWLDPTHWPLLEAFLGNNYASQPQKLEFALSDACCVPTNKIKGKVVDFSGQLERGTVINPESLMYSEISHMFHQRDVTIVSVYSPLRSTVQMCAGGWGEQRERTDVL